MLKLKLLLCALCLVIAPSIRAAEPPSAPILRIETGMHTSSIKRIATDERNRFLVTGGDDKTVRVWDLSSGALLSTLRVSIGEGNEGKINSVAISPDGETIACGGWTGYEWDEAISIYLFDRTSGQMRRRLSGLPEVATHLAFSPDGARLAVTLGDEGLRVFNVADGTLIGQDIDYGKGKAAYSVDFDSNGRLVTTCWDGIVRLYDAKFKLIAKRAFSSGKQLYRACFSPDGNRIAVGFADTTNVVVLDGSDLNFLFAPDISGVDNGDLSSVAWSADGRILFAGGDWWRKGKGRLVRRWSDGGQGAFTDLVSGADNTIFDLCPLRDGGLAFSAGDSTWGVLDSQGKRRTLQRPYVADFRDNQTGFSVATNGEAVQFGYEGFGKTPARFDVSQRALQGVGQPALLSILLTTVAPPRVSAPGLAIADWKYTTAPKLNGQPLSLEENEVSRSLAIATNGQSFVLGTELYLRRFDKTGRQEWEKPVPGVAWSVNISGNGKTVVAAFGDGTIRWYRYSDGQELLAFFPHADRKRWVLWTPTGYYDCSAGGEDLIGWHLNRGKDAAADFFPASKFHDTFYRPDVVGEVLKTLDETEALRVANGARGKTGPTVLADASAIVERLPPIVTLLSPSAGATVAQAQITVRYGVRSAPDAPVTAVYALVDGQRVAASRDLKLVADTNANTGETGTIAVPVPPRDCTVSVIAENRFGTSVVASVPLSWKGAAPAEEFSVKPKLYVLAIGISDYERDRDGQPDGGYRPDNQSGLDLNYGAKDARDFAAAMKAQSGGLYREVEARVLTDAQATRDGVMDGLDWIQHQTTSKDVAMVFLSGHGANDENGRYYFIPANFQSDRFRTTTVPFSEIQNTIQAIAGKALFFLDSCHAGNVMGTGKSKGLGLDINAVVNELSSADNGVIVFSASTGNQLSWEDPKWSNGAFTKAVIEGVAGGADYNKTGRITVNMLDLFISEKVKDLTGGRQTPTTQKPPTVPDFPLAIKR